MAVAPWEVFPLALKDVSEGLIVMLTLLYVVEYGDEAVTVRVDVVCVVPVISFFSCVSVTDAVLEESRRALTPRYTLLALPAVVPLPAAVTLAAAEDVPAVNPNEESLPDFLEMAEFLLRV